MRFIEYSSSLPDHMIIRATEGLSEYHREKVLNNLFQYGIDHVTAINEDAYLGLGNGSQSDEHVVKLSSNTYSVYPGGKQARQLTPGILHIDQNPANPEVGIESFVFFKKPAQIRAYIESRLSKGRGYDVDVPSEERGYAMEDLQMFAQGVSCGYLELGNMETAVAIAFLGTNGDIEHATRMTPIIDSMHPSKKHEFNTNLSKIAKNPENQAIQSWQV